MLSSTSIVLVFIIFFSITIGRQNKPAAWHKLLLSQIVVLILLHPIDLCILYNSCCTTYYACTYVYTTPEKLSKYCYLLALFGRWLLRLFCHWSTGLLNETAVTLFPKLPTLSLRYAFTTQHAGDRYQLVLITYRWSASYNYNCNRSKSIVIVNIIVVFSLSVSLRVHLLHSLLRTISSTHILVP